ncbi:MAG TPA: endopeptidase La [Desulfomicrobium sp.]|nr:endopeptidase La [Desulfomicrobium sp.]
MSDAIIFEKNHPGSLTLPVMSLREVVMFPKSIVPLFVGRDSSIKAIERALDTYDKRIFLVAQKDPSQERPEVDGLYDVGTVSKVLQMLRLPDGTIKVLFEGLYRASWDQAHGLVIQDEIQMVRVTALPDIDGNPVEGEALVRAAHEAVEEYAQVNRKLAKETVLAITSVNQPGRLADSIAPHLKATYDRKQDVLELRDPVRRLERVYELIQEEVEVFSLEKKIKGRVKKQMEENQKDYYLGEQLKAIHKEMGRDFDPKADVEDLENQLKTKDMPEDARSKAMAEMKKLRQTPPSSAEYAVLRNYVDWILALPWNVLRDVDIDIKQAQKTLDDDHYGLEKPKERILEYLAVQALVKKLRGPILCLVGPPGVGKTSLGKSIARSLGRKFVRMSLGGMRDEAEIRGHRRTYIGAMPGRIIQSMKDAGTVNPVIMLDEIDKLGSDFRGDPSSALLEVLDPEQNNSFTDHYLNVPYDLSKVMFICTANMLDTIPSALLDRMEVIRIPGYTEQEKIVIARRYLLTRQVKENGLTDETLVISDAVLAEIIRGYTREAGLRNLEREIGSVCRKYARRVAEGKKGPFRVTSASLVKLLGQPKFMDEERESAMPPGVALGLAWTPYGGEILHIECSLLPGKGKLILTGKLGDVMKESAQAALSYARSKSAMLGIGEDFFDTHDIHIHVPAGATPKDGPSAGVTLVTALMSAITNESIASDVAMTGEITLRGRVMPVGGIKEKILAAVSHGVSKVLIPARNAHDLDEIPKELRKRLTVRTIEAIDEIWPEVRSGKPS